MIEMTLNQLLKKIDRLGTEMNLPLKTDKLDFSITSVTTEEVFAAYRKKCDDVQAQTNTQISELLNKMDYYFELKNLVQVVNHEKGIDHLMLKQSMLSKKVAHIRKLITQSGYVDSDFSTDQDHPLDHFKSMFHDTFKMERVSDTPYPDMKGWENIAEHLEKERLEVSDKIAMLNQITKVSVPDFHG